MQLGGWKGGGSTSIERRKAKAMSPERCARATAARYRTLHDAARGHKRTPGVNNTGHNGFFVTGSHYRPAKDLSVCSTADLKGCVQVGAVFFSHFDAKICSGDHLMRGDSGDGWRRGGA